MCLAEKPPSFLWLGFDFGYVWRKLTIEALGGSSAQPMRDIFNNSTTSVGLSDTCCIDRIA